MNVDQSRKRKSDRERKSDEIVSQVSVTHFPYLYSLFCEWEEIGRPIFELTTFKLAFFPFFFISRTQEVTY